MVLPWILVSCCGETRPAGGAPSRGIAVLFVVDKSGSWAGNGIKDVRVACLSAIAELGPDDYAGILAFDVRPRWIAPFAKPSDRTTFEQSLAKVFADGGTFIEPALAEALSGFQADPMARAADGKHLILISDGNTLPGDLKGTVEKLGREGVSVTTVCVEIGGARSNASLMKQIAEWGRGRSVHVTTSTELKGVVSREIRQALDR